MITLGELFKIVKSLASSDIIDLKRCYYLHNIRDPVENIIYMVFTDASNSAYAAVV